MEIDYVCSPNFFHSGDLVIDVVNTIILLLIAFYSVKAYNCIRWNTGVCNRRFLQIGLAFGILAVAFGIKSYADFQLGSSVNVIIPKVIEFNNTLYDACVIGGSLVHGALTLIALYLLFALFMKKQTIASLAVFSLVALIAITSIDNFIIFYTTSAILLFFTGLLHMDSNGSTNKNAKLISISFIILAVSYLLFALISIDPSIYVVAKILRLVGFVLLLVSFMKVFYHGKKKK